MDPNANHGSSPRVLRALALLVTGLALGGCEVDSYFNPSITGYWEPQPTTIPILDRIDVIEREDDAWGQTTTVTSEDLFPNDLTYRAAPGDEITFAIYELAEAGQWTATTRRVGSNGFLRVPEIGEIQAAGRTAQELEDALVAILEQGFLVRPRVDVVLAEQTAFNYTLYGFVGAPGVYSLRSPDLRLLDALASAGGVAQQAKNIFVIRAVPLTEEVKPLFDQGIGPGSAPIGPPPTEPIDIEDLIDELNNDPGSDVRPGAFSQDEDPLPAGAVAPAPRQPPAIDIEQLRTQPADEGAWIFEEERGEWIRVPTGAPIAAAVPADDEERLYLERIIKIPAAELTRGVSKYNIVVRPKDRIYVEPPPTGMVYIEGQINRPGTFSLPSDGITLSRLVAAAGGLGQLAIPDRVDLIRMVGDNREAAMRMNLGAIRHRTEPDILLKPNDHIIIGTNFWAFPLAVMRSGFRATYGWGFLLDRNFGNDVFGAPPTNIGN